MNHKPKKGFERFEPRPIVEHDGSKSGIDHRVQ